MGFFTKKGEMHFEDFCFDFYETNFFGSEFKETDEDPNIFYADVIKKGLVEADSAFSNVDSQILADEILIMRFELFSLAWVNNFGIELSIEQSFFTNHYLFENDRGDIWDGMAHYNKAISHSAIVGIDKTTQAYIYKNRADLADKYISKYEKLGVDLSDELEIQSIGLAINREASKEAWKKGNTTYFIMLALCHRVGLGYGPSYTGPNKEAQLYLSQFIKGLYDGAEQSWGDIKIIQ